MRVLRSGSLRRVRRPPPGSAGRHSPLTASSAVLPSGGPVDGRSYAVCVQRTSRAVRLLLAPRPLPQRSPYADLRQPRNARVTRKLIARATATSRAGGARTPCHRSTCAPGGPRRRPGRTAARIHGPAPPGAPAGQPVEAASEHQVLGRGGIGSVPGFWATGPIARRSRSGWAATSIPATRADPESAAADREASAPPSRRGSVSGARGPAGRGEHRPTRRRPGPP